MRERTMTTCENCQEAQATMTIETMPEHLRASHETACNRGVYPDNGADRMNVCVDCADVMVDGDWTTNISVRVKIVDDFNGGELEGTYATRERAQEAVDRNREEFFSNLANQNAQYCKRIVPVTYTWYFNQKHNKFMWG